MDGNIVKLVFKTVTDSSGLTRFNGTLKTTAVEAQKTVNAAKGIVGALSSVGSSAGGAVGQVSQFVGAFAQLGAVGGIIAGVHIVIDRIAEHFKKKADEMAEAVHRMYERSRAALDRLVDNHMKKVTDALDAASTKAKDTAAAFNTLAAAYLKVGAAQDQTAKSARTAGLSGLQLEKAEMMASAGSDGERARIGSEYDVRIAREGLSATQEEQSALVMQANEGVAVAGYNAKLARKRERKAGVALAQAQKSYNLMVDEDGNAINEDVDASAFKAKLAEAERNYAEAVNDRVSKVAEEKEAEEKLIQAKNAQTAALNQARAAVVEAEAAQRNLARAQEEARKAEQERAEAERAKAEQERKSAKKSEYSQMIGDNAARGAQLSSDAARYGGAFEQAFALWRDPESAKAAQDEAKQREADMKSFRKAVGGYGAKWRIDEYASLMREGDEDGMQNRLEQWRKSAKFTPQVEQMVKAAAADQNRNAAEKSLANIEKNTADLAKKIDELLAVK